MLDCKYVHWPSSTALSLSLIVSDSVTSNSQDKWPKKVGFYTLTYIFKLHLN